MDKIIKLSRLGKTWILDLDGTMVIHNGYLNNGKDEFLSGAKAFLQAIPNSDLVVFVTSRKKEYAELTEAFLKENGIRYDSIIYGAPYGERILINDKKPSGLTTALAVNTERDIFCEVSFEIDDLL